MKRKRILIADNPRGQDLAIRALSNQYDLYMASTLREAMKLLAGTITQPRSRFQMIIAGVHFDDSRMIELLQYVRSVDHLDELPFLVLQAHTTNSKLTGGTAQSAKLLGACAVLDLAYDEPESAGELRRVVESCFDVSVAAKRVDRGASPRLSPEEVPDPDLHDNIL